MRGYSGTGAVGPAGIAGGAGAGGRAVAVDTFLLTLAELLVFDFAVVVASGLNGIPPTPNAIPLTTSLLGPLLRYPIASPAALSANPT